MSLIDVYVKIANTQYNKLKKPIIRIVYIDLQQFSQNFLIQGINPFAIFRQKTIFHNILKIPFDILQLLFFRGNCQTIPYYQKLDIIVKAVAYRQIKFRFFKRVYLVNFFDSLKKLGFHQIDIKVLFEVVVVPNGFVDVKVDANIDQKWFK